jgi:hypothetical protein
MKNVIAEHFKDNLKFGNLFFVNAYRKLPNLVREYAVYILSLLAPLTLPENRFVIFAQGRTGSTLLVDLINSHPDIFTYGEIFHKNVIKNVRNPVRFATGLMVLNKKSTCGFKVKVYQLINDQKQDPEKTLKSFANNGWKIIYLHRDNYFLHAISDLRSEKLKVWHELKSNKNSADKKIHISYEEMIEALEFRERNRIKEEECLRNIEHYSVSYEDDLGNAEKQKVFAKDMLQFLGLSETTLDTKLQKVVKGSLSEVIENYEELEKQLLTTRFSGFVKAA